MKEIFRILFTIFVGLLIFWLGYWMGKRSMRENYKERGEMIMEIIDSKSPEKQALKDKIDSLDLVIEEIKDTEARIDTVRILEVEKVAKLPLDSATMYLQQKISEYEEKFTETIP